MSRIRMAYDIAADGTVSNGRLVADVKRGKGCGCGIIKMPEIPANCNCADDWKSLFITARISLYRIKHAAAVEKQLYQ